MAEIEETPNIGAVRGVRWHDLPQTLQAEVTRGLS